MVQVLSAIIEISLCPLSVYLAVKDAFLIAGGELQSGSKWPGLPFNAVAHNDTSLTRVPPYLF